MTGVRIGTWNLECGGRTLGAGARQDDRLRELVVDVMVLTEPGPDRSVTTSGRVSSAPIRTLRRGAGAWVTIEGASAAVVGAPAPPTRMAAIAEVTIAGEHVVVYGSVLPWRGIRAHAPELVLPGESAMAAFGRVLAEQVADVRALVERYPGALVVWAGDFNQSLIGPNFSGSSEGRRLLGEALDSLGFVAWNAEAAHAAEGLCAIDLVCGPRGRRVAAVERIAPGRESDHAGYVVDVT